MIYNRNFFKRRVRRYHDREVTLAKIWYQYLKPTSVIDLGCGIGSYLAGFRQCGASVIGCEYGYRTEQCLGHGTRGTYEEKTTAINDDAQSPDRLENYLPGAS